LYCSWRGLRKKKLSW